MRDADREETQRRILWRLLRALADAKEFKPGAVNRRILSALARIPWMTPQMVTQPDVASLALAVGLTSYVVERERRGNVQGDITPEMEKLEQLATLAEYATPSTDDVVSLLLFNRQPPLRRVMVEALAQRSSHIGRRGAAARHAPAIQKREQLRAIWATGKFPTRRDCAEQQHGLLDIAYDTAIDALKGTPNPNPWPGKRKPRRS
jgi:hypothetical protein